jgi:hypothetical protein
MLKPLTHAQRVERFGRFSYSAAPTEKNAERIVIAPEWVAQNIASFTVAQLAALGRPTAISFHRLAGHRLVLLWSAWEAAGLLDRVLSFNGAWVPRFKRGKAGGGPASLSNHSWGTAFDINAKWNRLGQEPAAIGATGSVRELVSTAGELGFAWGGDFSTRPDGMHFEFTGEPQIIADGVSTTGIA